MNPRTSATPSRRPSRPLRAGAIALACAFLLGGCGLRLDAPPATEPVPDPVEIVRRTAVDDALLVAEQAEAVATRTGTKPAVADALARIAGNSLDHADQLGGVYSSGLRTDPATPSPSATRVAPAGPRAVLATLTDAAARNATAADVCEDGSLARLLASVSAAQTLSARKLAETTGRPLPPRPDPVIPAPGATASPGATDSPGTTEAAGRAAEVAGATGDQGPSGTTTAIVSGARPTTAPVGVSEENLVALVLAEDSTAYVYEVRAARTDDEGVRERLVDRAALHRQRAGEWAAVGGLADGERDPRRAAYQLPDPNMASTDVVLEAEGRLAADYASLVAVAEPDTRATAVALLTDSAVTLRAWGAGLLPFPGLPEQTPPD